MFQRMSGGGESPALRANHRNNFKMPGLLACSAFSVDETENLIPNGSAIASYCVRGGIRGPEDAV